MSINSLSINDLRNSTWQQAKPVDQASAMVTSRFGGISTESVLREPPIIPLTGRVNRITPLATESGRQQAQPVDQAAVVPLTGRVKKGEESPRASQMTTLATENVGKPPAPSPSLRGRLSTLDICALLFAMVALLATFHHLMRQASNAERAAQIRARDDMVKNYKGQGKTALITGIMGGVFLILASVAPVLGYQNSAGKSIQNAIGGALGLTGMSQPEFFKSISKMLGAMGKIQESSSRIHETFSRAKIVDKEYMGQFARADEENCSERRRNTFQDTLGTQQTIKAIVQSETEADNTLTRGY